MDGQPCTLIAPLLGVVSRHYKTPETLPARASANMQRGGSRPFWALTMIRILATALALTVAALALCGSLWRRDAASLVVARADAQRSSAAVTAAQKRETRCLGMVDAERAEVAACRRSADEAMSEARETERKACGRLVEAARAQGRLDVDPTDVSAVVRALRARRR